MPDCLITSLNRRAPQTLSPARLLALALLGMAALGIPVLRAQQTQPSPSPSKIAVEVKLVSVYATVRDQHGKIVPSLNKADFVLDEGGRPQTITHFARESDLPITLGLLVDTSYSQRSILGAEREASYTFLDHLLSAKDAAFVIHFDREVELLQDLTSSRPKLQTAIQLLETPGFNRDSDGGGDDGGRRHMQGGGTELYDAIYLASNDLMKKQQGRKALFVLSDGIDRGSKETLEDAIAAAQRADTSVYSILFAGQESVDRSYHRGGWGGMGRRPGSWPGRNSGGAGRGYPRQERPNGKKVLGRISTETGGRMFEVSKKLSLDQIYAQAQEELRNQYNLGFTPNSPDTEPGYHRIHLTTNQKGLTVQARDGYYSGP
jgi:VWFA-related protein